MLGSWGQALKLSHRHHNGQRSEQTRAYHGILPFQRCHVDHSLGTAALQEGRPKTFTVGSGGGQGFRPPCSHLERTALRTKVNPFQGGMAQGSTMKLKQKTQKFSLTPTHSLDPPLKRDFKCNIKEENTGHGGCQAPHPDISSFPLQHKPSSNQAIPQSQTN